MEQPNTLNFIITDPKDVSFTQHVYSARNFFSKFTPIVLHEFGHFLRFYEQADENFLFTVAIHAGMMDNGGDPIGKYILEEFNGVEAFKNIKPILLTRKADIFAGKVFEDKDGRTYFNSAYMNRLEFVSAYSERVPVYRKGDLSSLTNKSNAISADGKSENIDDRVDFAIITALYDDESTAFIENARKDKTFFSSMGNVLKLTFKEDDDSNDDYLEPFFLSHAQKMGMVDATFNATMLLEKLDPKFLIMAGVCGGKEGKSEVGKESKGLKYRDVIIANNIADIQIGKLEKGKFIPYLMNETTPHELITFIEQRKEDIKKRMYLLVDKKDPAFVKHVQDVVIRIADYGCGSQVINTDEYFREQISSRNNKALAVEMESYGIYRTCTLHNTLGTLRPTLPLVVKSVMDYTDENKTDEYKSDAAKMSYLCIRAMMPLLKEFYRTKFNR